MNKTYASPWPFTPAVKFLVIANVAIWLLEVVSVQWLQASGLVTHLSLTPERVLPGLELWQPVTYMFLHDFNGIGHILMNLLMLWMFGGQLEQSWGLKAFLRFYVICGVGAGLVVCLVGWLFDPAGRTLGASGAVNGLIVAWSIINWNRQFMFFGVVPMKGKHLALLSVAIVLVGILLRAEGESHAAHLGGLALGALLVTGWWRPSKLWRKLRLTVLRRKLKVIDGARSHRPPPSNGGYWN